MKFVKIYIYLYKFQLFFTHTHTHTHTHIYIYIYIYIYEVPLISFQTFFIWALLLIVHTWNSSPLWSNLLRLQCTLYHFNNFWKALWKSFCVSVSMTFITASFISSIVSWHFLSLGIKQKSQGARSGLSGGWGTVLKPILVK